MGNALLACEFIIKMSENISVRRWVLLVLFIQPVRAVTKLWWAPCRTKMCFHWGSIVTQISAAYLHCEFDNMAHILPC